MPNSFDEIRKARTQKEAEAKRQQKEEILQLAESERQAKRIQREQVNQAEKKLKYKRGVHKKLNSLIRNVLYDFGKSAFGFSGFFPFREPLFFIKDESDNASWSLTEIMPSRNDGRKYLVSAKFDESFTTCQYTGKIIVEELDRYLESVIIAAHQVRHDEWDSPGFEFIPEHTGSISRTKVVKRLEVSTSERDLVYALAELFSGSPRPQNQNTQNQVPLYKPLVLFVWYFVVFISMFIHPILGLLGLVFMTVYLWGIWSDYREKKPPFIPISTIPSLRPEINQTQNQAPIFLFIWFLVVTICMFIHIVLGVFVLVIMMIYLSTIPR